MKKQLLKTIPVAFLSLALLFAGCSKDKENNNANNNNNYNNSEWAAQVNLLPIEPLNPDELTSLPFMREEEKLARDVYTFLYNKWGSLIFKNISNSEQTHMDAVLHLLTRYSLPDPVGANGPGVFTNPLFRDLYIQLTTQGSLSRIEAMKVGCTIEDLDINDLQDILEKVDNQDITFVYNNLMKGSRNHLRSFYSNLLALGGTYVAQYITQAEFDAIVNSPMETGF